MNYGSKLQQILISRHIQMSWDTIHHYRAHITLDKRSYICDKLVSYISSVLCDPLSWNKSLVICDLMNILNLGSCLIRII